MIIDDLPLVTLPPKQAPPKLKIEFTDKKGAKYSFAVEGPSKENILKLMDFIETISTKQPELPTSGNSVADTNFNKVFGLVQNKFRFGSFTSSDVLEAYEQHFQLRSTLSTISTYLARLAERGLLTRSRNGSGWIYKLLKIQQQLQQRPNEEITQSSSTISLITR